MQAKNLVLVELGNSFKGISIILRSFRNISKVAISSLLELSEGIFSLFFSSSSIKREVSPGKYEEVMKPPEMFMRM